MVEEPGSVAPVAPSGVRAGLALEAEFDDVRIAGRRHNPPYGLFAVLTFIARVREKSKQDFFAIMTAFWGYSVGSRLFFMSPTKREYWSRRARGSRLFRRRTGKRV
jgi:hypothetical protein